MMIEPGQRWTFVDASGERTEYLLGNPNDDAFMDPAVRAQLWARWEPNDHPHSIVYLLNEKTGKYAMVTRYWLRGLPHADGRSHWLPPVLVAS